MTLYQVYVGDVWLSWDSLRTIGIATSPRSAFKILKEYAEKEKMKIAEQDKAKDNILNLKYLQGDLVDKDDENDTCNSYFIDVVATNTLVAWD